MTGNNSDRDASQERGSGERDRRTDDPETAVRRERFSGGPAREFLSSMAADDRIFEADLAVDRAHVVMLTEQDVLDPGDAGEILRALDDIGTAGYGKLPAGEDVHEAIETAVIDRVGPEGGRMHTARSRNDEVATCLRYRLREDLLATIETVVEARAELLDVASEHTGTLLPGYTHLQPAQPTTVAHWLCSYEQALARDTARLLDAYERVNQSPLGAAAFAGTPFDVDRDRTAELLGFDGVIENAMDAVSTRDFLVETTAAVSGLALTLSGLAEDTILFVHRDYLDLADEYASTSSIMPQKKNPDTLELVRGRTGDATAGLDGLVTTLKGLPRAYNRDLQRASHHAWGAIDSVTEATAVAIGAVSSAEWNEEVVTAAAGEGFTTATGVADLLARAGIPFRTAHEIVARAGETDELAEMGADDVDESIDAIARVAEETLGEPLRTYVDESDLERVLDPRTNVTMRDSYGGPAPDAIEAALGRSHDRLGDDRETLSTHRNNLETAHEKRHAEVSRYV